MSRKNTKRGRHGKKLAFKTRNTYTLGANTFKLAFKTRVPWYKRQQEIRSQIRLIREEGWDAWVMREMGGHFLDKDDLEKMYEDKPDELAGIFARAIKVHCPVRCVDLWEHLRWREQERAR